MSKYLELAGGRLTVDGYLDRDKELPIDLESGGESISAYLTIDDMKQLRDLLNELLAEEPS